MKITISGSRSHKIQAVQYEPVDIGSFLSIEAEVPGDMEPEEYAAVLSAKIQTFLEADLRRNAIGITKKHSEIAKLAKTV